MTDLILFGIPGYDENSVSDFLKNSRQYDDNITIHPTRPGSLAKALKQAVIRKRKTCILLVIPKGRITEEIEQLSKTEIELICSARIPVVLFITGCAKKEFNWWNNNQQYFEPYGFKNTFSEIVHGDLGENGNFDHVTIRANIFRSIEQHSNTLDESFLRELNSLNLIPKLLQNIKNINLKLHCSPNSIFWILVGIGVLYFYLIQNLDTNANVSSAQNEVKVLRNELAKMKEKFAEATDRHQEELRKTIEEFSHETDRFEERLNNSTKVIDLLVIELEKCKGQTVYSKIKTYVPSLDDWFNTTIISITSKSWINKYI